MKLIVSIILGFVLGACQSYDDNSQKRAQDADDPSKDIVIGVVSSDNGTFFSEGVRLAIEQTNDRGGILGRRLKAVYLDDHGDPKQAGAIARKLSRNTDVIAVVGHRHSDLAISAAVTYEQNGVVLISPGASQPDFTQYGGRFTFRNTPSDEIIGRQIALFAARQKFKNVLVLFDRESPFKRLTEIFQENAAKEGIKIVSAKTYTAWEQDFRLMLADIMKEYQFDAVFLGGEMPAAGLIIEQLRSLGVSKPIIGSGQLDSIELYGLSHKISENIIVPTIFNPGSSNGLTINFIETFKDFFGFAPDTWAAKGYDAISLLEYAIEKNGSAVPVVISTNLKFLTDWHSVFGTYSFTADGDIINSKIYFKSMKNRKFKIIEEQFQKINPFTVLIDETIRIPISGEINTLDPTFAADTLAIEVAEQLFLGLTDLDPETYQPVPELAESWEKSEDQLTYTFKLRQDVFWTNGNPVTAHDIVWAIQRNINPDTKCPYAGSLYLLKNAEAIHKGQIKDISQIGVCADDNYTLEFQLENPAPYFTAMVGMPVFRPLPENTIKKYKEQWTALEHLQTNGSYKLAAWTKGMVMIFRKNDAYFDAKNVMINEVRYYTIPKGSVGMTMYKNNQLDIMGDAYLRIPMAEIPKIKIDPVLVKEYHKAPLFCTYAYGFNTILPPLDNVLVRKALSISLNRDLINDILANGSHEPATTFTRPPIPGSVAPSERVGLSFNPVQGAQWLAQAGYPDGKGFPEITLVYNQLKSHTRIAKAVQTCLKYYLNINLRLVSLPFKDYIETITGSNPYHLFKFTWCADYPDANNWLNELLNPSNAVNYLGWDNSEFIELMEQVQLTQSAEQRHQLFKRAEVILCEEECALMPVYFESAHYLVKPRIKDWQAMSMGGQHIRDWSFKQE